MRSSQTSGRDYGIAQVHTLTGLDLIEQRLIAVGVNSTLIHLVIKSRITLPLFTAELSQFYSQNPQLSPHRMK